MSELKVNWVERIEIYHIIDEESNLICTANSEEKANKIIKCCNAFEEGGLVEDLLQACERFKKLVIKNRGNTVWDANYDYIEAALAAAEPQAVEER